MTGNQMEKVEELIDMYDLSELDQRFLENIKWSDTELKGNELLKFKRIIEKYQGYGYEER